MTRREPGGSRNRRVVRGTVERMAESVPIGADRPRLEGVLGPLTPAAEREARQLLVATSGRLVELARAVGGRAGWHGSGLELMWIPSGQLSIDCAVEALDAQGHAVAFCVDLMPGWFYGVAEPSPRWTVERRIQVDCRHAADHRMMEPVLEVVEDAADALGAVHALADSVEQLIRCATAHPLEHWTARTLD